MFRLIGRRASRGIMMLGSPPMPHPGADGEFRLCGDAINPCGRTIVASGRPPVGGQGELLRGWHRVLCVPTHQ